MLFAGFWPSCPASCKRGFAWHNITMFNSPVSDPDSGPILAHMHLAPSLDEHKPSLYQQKYRAVLAG